MISKDIKTKRPLCCSVSVLSHTKPHPRRLHPPPISVMSLNQCISNDVYFHFTIQIFCSFWFSFCIQRYVIQLPFGLPYSSPSPCLCLPPAGVFFLLFSRLASLRFAIIFLPSFFFFASLSFVFFFVFAHGSLTMLQKGTFSEAPRSQFDWLANHIPIHSPNRLQTRNICVAKTKNGNWLSNNY